MSEEQRKRDELASMKAAMYGLAGVCVLLLIETLKFEKPDRALTVAAYCFVVAIPLLVSFGILVDLWLRSGKAEIGFPALGYFMFSVAGGYAAVGGIVAYLWHHNVGTAIAFLAAIAGGAVIFFGFQRALYSRETPKNDAPEEK